MKKHTKIVATIGPSSNNIKTLEYMIKKGVEVFRLNFSHGNYEEHLQNIKLIKERENNVNGNISILQDICGPKIRITSVIKNKIYLEKKEKVIISKIYKDNNCFKNENGIYLFINNPTVLNFIQPNDNIFIADGKIKLEVEEINENEVICNSKSNGVISSNKGVNFPDTEINIDILTQKDIEDIKFGILNEVDFIALSFVQNENDVENAKNIINNLCLENSKPTPKVFSKIEKFDAIKNINNIIKVSDGIMIARGDLGIEIPYFKLPLIQKKIIQKCKEYNLPVIVATQTLFSMTENEIATRAEISDVANAILDGADAIMLSEETAIGKYPKKVIKTLSEVSLETEKFIDDVPLRFNGDYSNKLNALAKTISQMANNFNVDKVIVITNNGKSPLFISKNMINRRYPIIALPFSKIVQKQLNIVKSVYSPFVMTETNFLDKEFLKKIIVKLINLNEIDVKKDYIFVYNDYISKQSTLNSIKLISKNEISNFLKEDN